MKKLYFLLIAFGMIGFGFALSIAPKPDNTNEASKKITSQTLLTPKQQEVMNKFQNYLDQKLADLDDDQKVEKLETLQKKLRLVELLLKRKIATQLKSGNCDTQCKIKRKIVLENTTQVIELMQQTIQNNLNTYLGGDDMEDIIIGTGSYYNYGGMSWEEVQKIINEGANTFTQDEKQKVADSIQNLQTMFFEKVDGKVSKRLSKLKYTQKGDMKLDFMVDARPMGDPMTTQGSFEITDMTASTDGFNSQFMGNLVANITSNISSGDTNMSMPLIDMSMIFDYLSVNGISYVKISDLQTKKQESNTMMGMSDSKMFTDMLQKIQNANKYVRLVNSNIYDDEYENMMSMIHPTALRQKINDMMNQPILEVYKKEQDKYYLMPTKHLCDMVYSMDVGKKCTDEMYQAMLGDYMAVNTKLYLQFHNNYNILGLEADDSSASFDGKITYTNTAIQSIIFEGAPKYDEKQYIKLQYNKNSAITINMNVDESTKFKFDFKGQLDDEDNFTNINANLDSDNVVGTFTFANNNYNGNLKISGQNFNYDTQSMENTQIANITLKGQTNDDNTIKSMDLGINADQATIDIEFDKTDGVVTSAVFNINMNSPFLQIASNNKLENKTIDGSTSVSYGGKKVFDMTTSGEYYKDYLDIQNAFTFMNPMGFGQEEYSGNLNLKSDATKSPEQINLGLDVNMQDTKIIDINMDATQTSTPKPDLTINAPTDYVNLDTLMQN